MQVPVDRGATGDAQVRRLRRRPATCSRWLRAGRAGRAALPRGAGHGLGRRRRLLRARPRGRPRTAGHLRPRTRCATRPSATALVDARRDARTPATRPARARRRRSDRLLALPCWPHGVRRRAPRAGRAQERHQPADRPVLPGRRARHPRGVRRRRRCAATPPTWWCRARRGSRCEVLKAVAARYVMGRDDADAALRRPARARARAGRRAVAAGAGRARPAARATPGAAAPTTPRRLRVVIDQVASLTDTSATALHARLTSRKG